MRRSARTAGLLTEVYERLFAHHGPQGWWPGEGGPFETIVGAVLTQNTAWTNVDKALANLRAAGLMTPAALRAVPEPVLAEAIRPSGYFNTKARKLKAVAEHLARHGDDTGAWAGREAKELRTELLGVYGIGPETADDIVLYVAGLPSFVIDTYTIRLMERLGLRAGRGRYGDWQELFERHLPADAPLFNEYHALLDAHAKDICRKRDPRCGECVLIDLCPQGREAAPSC